MTRSDTPDWAPLVAAIGSDIAEWFMWMHEVRLDDGSRLHAYKNRTTRRYLHLATDGRAFDYDDAWYPEVALASAIALAFIGWEVARPPWSQVLALRAAVEAAHRRR